MYRALKKNKKIKFILGVILVLGLFPAARCFMNQKNITVWEEWKKYDRDNGNVAISQQQLNLDRFVDKSNPYRTDYGTVSYLYGYKNEHGEIQIQPSFVSCDHRFYENLAWATSSEGRLGFINLDGSWAFFVNADYARHFSNGRAEIKRRQENGFSLSGFVDRNGNVIVEPEYKKVRSYVSGYSLVWRPTWTSIVLDTVLFGTSMDIDVCFKYRIYIIDKNGDRVSASDIRKRLANSSP